MLNDKYANDYYKKRFNLDPERCQINLERAILRKRRESQVIVTCQHKKTEWCQIRNIKYSELENFHDRYWNCTGTVNKRVFVAKYLTVHSVRNNNSKRDLNITCHCPRKNGSKVIICQKSFISVLGLSKHKVLAIGRAKLLNSEQLYKETRGGSRLKNKTNNNKWELESSTIDSNHSINGHDNGNNHEIDNENNMTDENSENDSDEINVVQSTIEISDSARFEKERNMNNPNTKYFNDDSNDSDIEICSPTLSAIQISESDSNSNDDDNNGGGNMFEPDIEMKETENILSNNTQIYSQPPTVRLQQRNEIYIRKKTQQLPQLRRQFNTKTTAASGSVLLRPKKYELVKIKVNNEQPEEKEINIQHQLQLEELTRTKTNRPYLGPANWKKTIERNQRRLQREKEVSISCTHNMTRFCKIQYIPKEDLVNFHQGYWRCQGIVEERIFLSRYLIVTPRSNRREMTILHRIPTSDGTIYDVCQKSFLSVVGITKHKVQAVARAVLRGEIYKKDGRGGCKVKHLKQIDEKSLIKSNNDNEELITDHGNSNYSQTKDCTLQIAEVIGNYNPKMNGVFDIEIKSEPAIEINDSNDNSNFTPSIDDTINIEMVNNDSNNIIQDKSNIERIDNENNNYKKIKYDKFNSTNKLKTNLLERNLMSFKRKSKKLVKDRKRLWEIISRLRMENFNLKNNKIQKL